MGYYSYLKGEIEISPAPPKSLFDRAELETMDRGVRWGIECLDVQFEVESETKIETDGLESVEITRSTVISAKIVVTCDDRHKHYYTCEGLQAIVDQLGREREYKGWFDFEGEDARLARFGVVNGKAREFEPTITWPAEVS